MTAGASQPRPTTLGALRESGWRSRSVKDEIRDNLIAAMREGRDSFPGIRGYEDTVIPALERALLAGHDMILLGERGQAKTRLIRSMVALLDEHAPVIDECEINDDPLAPVCAICRDTVAERGDDTPVAWIPRAERYAEKLATPDIAVADLIGDIDPIRVAEGRYLADERTIHYGLVPRTNRGIFAINELPDLPERIQVGLLNILEERDVQIRGYSLRLDLDVLLVATANPEDYTNRGRIITPLKDRFGSEIRTHYPQHAADEVAIVEQEMHPHAAVPVKIPPFIREILVEFTRLARRCAG
ncbi:MAG TPA: sigma 54-interacting transcriptional regulator, partial [Actinomycetota bacterium]|nr:sigma 54-interacting transcriptional regulator [Actinomycetota bacterium]